MKSFARAFAVAAGGSLGIATIAGILTILLGKAAETSIRRALRDIEDGFRRATDRVADDYFGPLHEPESCPDRWHGAGADLAQMSEVTCPTCGDEA